MRAGDRDAYRELVLRHAAAAHRTALLMGAGDDAADVVQESFVKAYRSLPRFRPGSPFRPWLMRIVANETRNLHRAAGRRAAVERSAGLEAIGPLLQAQEAADPAGVVISSRRREELLSAVADLPERQRLVVTCRYLLELDEAETATVLGWPRGTVKSRLHRALGRLRESLDGFVGDPGQPRERGRKEASHGTPA